MIIAFDLHGVLDECPEIFNPMIKMLKACGHSICIVSGPSVSILRKELEEIGLTEYTYSCFSVVDFLTKNGVMFTNDEKGDPWCDEQIWWDAKARICKENNIDVLIDDSIKYKPAFELIDSKYIHVSELL